MAVKLKPLLTLLIPTAITLLLIYYVANIIFTILSFTITTIIIWWLFLSPSDINDKEYSKLLKKRNLIQDRYSTSKATKNKYDIIMIGSGTAGLNCGAILSRLGYKILILEQHYVAGGGTHEFELTNKENKNKYKFDSGLHYAIPLSEPIMHLVCGTSSPPVPWLRLGSDQNDKCYDWIVLGDSMNERKDFFRIKHDEQHLADIHKLINPKNEPKLKSEINAVLNAMGYAMKLFPFWVFQRFIPVSWQRVYRKYVLNSWLNFTKYAGRNTQTVLDELTSNNKLKSLVSGLWLDTGSPPTQCSFMLSSSVFRGFPHEGGAYPKGGSTNLAKALTAIIKMNGGNVLCRAKVKKIMVNYNGKAKIKGVEMENGDKILCSQIISSAGYNNTFSKLFNKQDQEKLDIKYPIIPDLDSSYSFLLCNIGLNGNYKDLDIEDTNLWYQPINNDNNWSIFKAITDFIECKNYKNFTNEKNIDFCCGFTWPSIKAKDDDLENSKLTSCQILIMAPWKWFNEWYDNGKFKSGDNKNINKEYQAFKQIFMDECIKKLYKYYPKCKGNVDFIDLSTPLSLEYYLKSDKGGAIGLDVTPNRFINDKILDLTDCNRNDIVRGLWMTGQDFLICGIPICQASGIITALRFVGFKKSLKFLSMAVRTGVRSYVYQ